MNDFSFDWSLSGVEDPSEKNCLRTFFKALFPALRRVHLKKSNLCP